MQVLAIRTVETIDSNTGKKKPLESIVIIPDANFQIEPNHILIIMGDNKNIEEFRKLH